MNSLFPKEIPPALRKTRPNPAWIKVIGTAAAITIPFCIYLWGADVVSWIIPPLIVCLVAGAWLLRCPACGGPFSPAPNLGFCPHCGSRIAAEPTRESGLEFVPASMTATATEDSKPSIVEKSHERLSIKLENPKATGALILLGGLVFFWFACPSLMIRCSRSENDQIQISAAESLLGWTRSWNSISNVTGIEVRPFGSRNNSSATYRLAAQTPDGEKFLRNSGDNNLQGNKVSAERIRGFIRDPGRPRQLTIIQPPHWIAWVASISLLGLGTYLMIRRSSPVQMDRNSSRIRLGRNFDGNPMEYELNDVECFGVATRSRALIGNKSDPSESPVSCVAMRLRTGAIVFLSNSQSSTGLKEKNAAAGYFEKFFRDCRRDQGQADETPENSSLKVCGICGQDCSTQARMQDSNGCYYHKACFESPK